MHTLLLNRDMLTLTKNNFGLRIISVLCLINDCKAKDPRPTSLTCVVCNNTLGAIMKSYCPSMFSKTEESYYKGNRKENRDRQTEMLKGTILGEKNTYHREAFTGK